MKRVFWPSAGGIALAGALLFWLPGRRRNRLVMLGLFVLIAFSGMMGCGGRAGNSGAGGGRGNAGTTPGTYTVHVTGTSGSLTVTLATVTVTVE
jgi:hypothetical protein